MLECFITRAPSLGRPRARGKAGFLPDQCAGTQYFVALCLASWLLGGLVAPAVGHTIALDVGHSLAHPGATSARGVPEFVFNKALAAVVRDTLVKQGFHVRMIGAQGDMHDLQGRTRAAVGADFFLSLHHDSVQPRYLEDWVYNGIPRRFSDRFAGFSLFVSRTNPQPSASLACASQLGTALRHAGFAPSPHHAEPIPGENRPFADRTNGVHYFDDLVVLKTATQPALLLEAGVIVHRAEELALQQSATRETMATAIAAAMDMCLRTKPLSVPSQGDAR
jgi:N-acetylmuramoyl-L-alanine amidase